MNYYDPERQARTEEARRVGDARRALQHNQASDQLRERARLIAYWRKAELHYHPSARSSPRCPLNWAIYRNPVFWKYLLPGLRAKLEAKARTHEAAWQAQMRESGERWRQLKAERAAAKSRAASPQKELLA